MEKKLTHIALALKNPLNLKICKAKDNVIVLIALA